MDISEIDISKCTQEEQTLLKKKGSELTREDLIELAKMVRREMQKINEIFSGVLDKLEANKLAKETK